MKRSEINAIKTEAEAFIRSFGTVLPPFANWSIDQMRSDQAAVIRERGLGWDITDYGQGRFDELGLFLFTLRNGDVADLNQGRGMLYAEKLLVSRDKQLSPMHRHIIKAEDIINRGGGDLVMEIYASDPVGGIDRENAVIVPSDGCPVSIQPGELLRLRPGQSVTLMPGIWHAFWAEMGDCLIGEVSTVNDDRTDNVFEDPIPRFATIEEDAAQEFLLVADY
ncbi:ABC-type sugar transport system, auxiliary component [Ruegeria sp. THAF57]|uniref:D-lyxose/D-mannose family sugar isomerase n=1 Tax=Ruegeria sp. THAF57 TaxID=2744555 RepID=UPI0015DF4B4F|nr:D-lyxose/D-mannose family sugar isomerase [Ruegeria sp. THAF57]CAD0187089.1 ABC-type sugar transport system, auxiliary component [Ruegeria sp. THAF57]